MPRWLPPATDITFLGRRADLGTPPPPIDLKLEPDAAEKAIDGTVPIPGPAEM